MIICPRCGSENVLRKPILKSDKHHVCHSCNFRFKPSERKRSGVIADLTWRHRICRELLGENK